MVVKGENYKIGTFSTRHQTGFGLGFYLKVLTVKSLQVLFGRNSEEECHLLYGKACVHIGKSARNKPHSENMHGFTVNQSYTTTYKTHYKSTTLHIDSAQNKEANISSKNNG